jgi:hypothetical protein
MKNFLKYLAPLAFAAITVLPLSAAPLTGAGVVTIDKRGAKFTLERDGQPYYVKGVGGKDKLPLAVECGANSIRTWNIEDAVKRLDEAQKLGLTVTLGLWLDHKAGKYKDKAYLAKTRRDLEGVIAKVKNHPALLCYALGNEINLGADTPEAWKFVDELAEICAKNDPNHPIMSVIAGAAEKTINNVATYAPKVQILGVNAYRGVTGAPGNIEKSKFKGPYMITEWGPWGHWEVAKTSWGAPVEQNSSEKAKSYEASYKLLLAHSARCIGSYVFLWGQKQERTPTWYGLFVEKNKALGLDGESTPPVDVMTLLWSGKAPANTAPALTSVTVNGAAPSTRFIVASGKEFTIEIKASDTNGDALSYVWEVLPEATKLGEGGSFEPRPASVAGAVKATTPGAATVSVSKTGNYRVFGYVLDGKGKVATANVPFKVQ